MPLKTISANVPAAAAPKSDMPVHVVRGNVVARYNQAHADAKDADSRLKEAEAELKPFGLKSFINDACQGADISSVKLVDATGAVARFTFQAKYNLADAANADAIFTELGADINDYAAETVKPVFDAKFFVDGDGDFDEAIYEATVKALASVAAKFGKANPLSGKKIVTPKPNFVAERFTKFDATANLRLCEALPNTCTLQPSK